MISRIEFNPNYAVSTNGNVFNVKAKRKLKPRPDKDGYLRCRLDNREYSVHKLVALTFIPNQENKSQINHKSLNKQDNSAENLEWVTPSENLKHYYRMKRKLGK